MTAFSTRACGPDPSDTGLLSRPPGYPAFVAVVYRFVGRGYVAVLAAQALLGALLPPLLLALTARVAGAAAGVVAGVLAALSPPLGYFTAQLTPDALAALLAVLLLGLVWRGRRVARGWFLAAGCVAGVATWLRPNFLLLAPALLLVLPSLLPGRATLRWCLALVAVAAAAVAPITLRNWRLYGAFVPVSINMGIVMWEGIADAGGARFGARPADLEVAEDEALRHADPRYAAWWASPDGVARDHERLARSLAVVRTQPLWFLAACVRRAGAILDVGAAAPLVAASPPAAPAEGAVETVPRWLPEPSGLRRSVRLLQRLLCWTGALARPLGLLLLALAAPRRAAFLLILPVYVLALQAPLHFEPRFALPLYAFAPAFEAVAWVAAARALGLVRRA